jgi:hypothetical protein
VGKKVAAVTESVVADAECWFKSNAEAVALFCF